MEAFEMALLYDYYGAMLTGKQQEYLDLRYNQDMSLGEIAEFFGVSRQAVFDNLSRTEAQLRRMEEKIGCIRRDRLVEAASQTILAAARQLQNHPEEAVAAAAGEIIRAAKKLEE